MLRTMTGWLTALLLPGLLLVLPAYAQQPVVPNVALAQGITVNDFAAYPEAYSELQRGDLPAALALLQSQLAEHENDAAYFNLIGTLALKLRDFSAAAVAFERVVLMQPDNAGAWMDLAIASVESGNPASAISYFNHIESTFEPSPALLVIIAKYRAGIARPVLTPFGWKLQSEALAGFDSNANSGLQNSIIPITLGNQRVDLLLDGAYRARSDRFLQEAVSANLKQPYDIGVFDLNLSARQRNYQHEHDFSSMELNLGAGMRRATPFGDAGLGLNVAHLSLGGAALVRTLRATTQLEQPLGSCRVGIAGEGEWRRYFNLSTLDANILWGQGGLACDWGVAKIPVQTTFIVRTGFDKPVGPRPGGKTRHSELIAQLGAPVAWGMYGELSYTLARAYDTDGYSALLEQNAAREIDRRSLRLTLTQPVKGGGDVIFTLEDNHVFSNLSLFRQAGRILGAGFRKSF